MGESSAQQYEKAMELLKENKYTEAGRSFAALGTYADSPRYTMYCNAIAAGEAGLYSIAVENLNSLSGFLDSNLLAIYYAGLSWEAAEDYERASEVLSGITLYRDVATRMAGYPALIEARDAAAAEQARANAYAAADRAEQKGDYATAYSGFSNLGDYQDSAARAAAVQNKGKYAQAIQCAMSGDYSSAYSLFDSLGDYEESAIKAYILSVTSFATVEDRGNGVAAFKLHDAWGILNVNDNIILSPIWDSIGSFDSLGLAMVSRNNKYGYINTQGEVTVACEWDEVSAFSGSLCTVRQNSSFGLVDAQGRVVSEAQWKTLGGSCNVRYSYYVYAPAFSEEKIKVQDSNGKWGFIDTDGKLVGEVAWDEIQDFSEGFAAVSQNEKYGFIDKNGQIVIQPQYTAVRSFHEGLAAVQESGKWKYINAKNETVIPARYSQALDFSDGKADAFFPGTGWQVIDKEGSLVYFISSEMITDYNLAVKLEEAGELEQAFALFSGMDYKDSAERARKVLYNLGTKKREAQDWEGAVQAFEQAESYGDAATQITETRYQQAAALNKAGKYEEAYAIYAAIAGYKDVDSIVKTDEKIAGVAANAAAAAAREAMIASCKKAGSYVTFGTYPQTSSGTDSTPIEWMVLDYDAANNRALLISRYGLDAQPYNEKSVEITWEKCTLRTWLNSTFYNKAFSTSEQSAILPTNVDNSSSQGFSLYSTSGGNNTQDKIFLLSVAEAYKYFNVQYSVSNNTKSNNTKSLVQPTAYAIEQGAYISNGSKTAEGTAAGIWWLRSPGSVQDSAAFVNYDGSLLSCYVYFASCAVRPAFWLDLNADIF